MKEQEQKLTPITHKKLKNLFISPNFAKGIKKSTKINLERGTESHFSVWYNAFSGEIKYFFPKVTTYDLPCSTGLELDDKQDKEIDDQKLIPLIKYHYHPSASIHPSEADLTAYFYLKGEYNFVQEDPSSLQSVENYHMSCIGATREAGKIHDVLVLQNTSKSKNFLEGEIAYDQLLEKLRYKEKDNASIAKALDDLTNWNAHLLTYERKNKNQKYQISEEQLSGLDKFSYVPILKLGELDIEEVLNDIDHLGISSEEY